MAGKVKIYITHVLNNSEFKTEKRYANFKGSDGNCYAELWVIERATVSLGAWAGANINGETVCIDATVPTEVSELPGGAKKVPKDLAEKLWKMNSHYFGAEDPKGFR